MLQGVEWREFLVVYCEYCDRNWGVYYVVQLVDPGIVNIGTREVVIETVPQLWQDQYQIFIEIEEYKLWVLPIGLPAMIQHKLPQNLKLSNGIIRTQSSLGSLDPLDPHTNMGRIDHINIISTITNTESRTAVLTHEPHHVLFLFWSHSAANYWFAQVY